MATAILPCGRVVAGSQTVPNSHKDMDVAVRRSSCYAPVDLTERARPDLATLMAVGHPGSVGNNLCLNPTGVPQLCGAIA